MSPVTQNYVIEPLAVQFAPDHANLTLPPQAD